MNTKGGLRDGDLKGILTQSNDISSEREGVIITEGEMGLQIIEKKIPELRERKFY